MTVSCGKDDTSEMLDAIVLESRLMVVFNATFENFVVYHQITEAETTETVLIADYIGLTKVRDLDNELAPLIAHGVESYNAKFEGGQNLANKWPTVKFVAGMLQQTLLTPYSEDGFLFGGFKWLSDFF